MSWSASGAVNGANLDSLPTPPNYNELSDGAKNQVDILMDFLKDAFAKEVLEGSYSVSLYGHYPAEDGSDSDRKTLGFSLSPVTLEVEAASDDTP